MTDDASAKSHFLRFSAQHVSYSKEETSCENRAWLDAKNRRRNLWWKLQGRRAWLKNCDHVVSDSISQRYVRARESRCVNRRETYRAPIIRGESGIDTYIRYLYGSFFFLLGKFSTKREESEISNLRANDERNSAYS